MSPYCCAALAWSHSAGITCGRTVDSVPPPLRWTSRQVPVTAPYISPLANASLPRASFFCHLTERLVSFSLRAFVRMWAARTLWHARGLPMRLGGDSETAARQNDLQNCRRGLERGCSQPFTWVTVALFALLSCCTALLFSFLIVVVVCGVGGSVAGSFQIVTVRFKALISLVPYFERKIDASSN